MGQCIQGVRRWPVNKTLFSNYIHKTSDSFCKTIPSPQNSFTCAQNRAMLSDLARIGQNRKTAELSLNTTPKN